MDSAEKILEPYSTMVESGNPPTFESVMKRFIALIDNDPCCYEIACLGALLCVMYPAKFGRALNDECLKRGFPGLPPGRAGFDTRAE